jgi:hypothetical protein
LSFSDILAPQILKELQFSLYSARLPKIATEKRGEIVKRLYNCPLQEREKPGFVEPGFPYRWIPLKEATDNKIEISGVNCPAIVLSFFHFY